MGRSYLQPHGIGFRPAAMSIAFPKGISFDGNHSWEGIGANRQCVGIQRFAANWGRVFSSVVQTNLWGFFRCPYLKGCFLPLSKGDGGRPFFCCPNPTNRSFDGGDGLHDAVNQARGGVLAGGSAFQMLPLGFRQQGGKQGGTDDDPSQFKEPLVAGQCHLGFFQ